MPSIVLNKYQRNRGQAMVEMVVITMVVLLLLFAILQFAFLYNAKTILNYATFEAARAGAVNHASPLAMQYALAQKLAAVAPHSDQSGPITSGSGAYQRLTSAQSNLIEQISSNNIACIQRISPAGDSSHFDEPTSDGGLKGYDKEIPNQQLIYRSTSHRDAQGLTIQDANLLKIKVQYCHEMIVPLIPQLVRSLMLEDDYNSDPDALEGWTVPRSSRFQQSCYARGLFPLEAQAIVRMQTELRNYPASFPLGCEL